MYFEEGGGMKSLLSKIRELAKFDMNTVKENAEKYRMIRPPQFIDSIIGFKDGNRQQHSQLSPLIEQLLLVIEIQGNTLDKIKGGYSVLSSDFKIVKKIYPETEIAREAQSEVSALLNKIVEGKK